MIAYEAEGDGRLFQDMVPKRAAAATQTSLSSKVELELHTEQAFSDLRPDWISLACAREHPGADTYVLPVGAILPALTDSEIALLKEPLWVTGVDESFRVGGHDFLKGDRRGPMPILEGDDDDLGITLDQDLMSGTTDEATKVMEKLYEIYRTHRLRHTLKRGELLLLDNRRAVHGRSPFKPRFDGTDRFVIRSFVVKDLHPSSVARARHSLTVRARFS
jgi:L-asparagine oxygenase